MLTRSIWQTSIDCICMEHAWSMTYASYLVYHVRVLHNAR